MTREWTDAEGRFVLEALEDRDHVITVSADGYEPRSVAGVRPTASREPLEFHLLPRP